MTSDTAFDIFYTAYSGRPPVDATLHIFPDGRAEVYIGTYASVPDQKSDQIGFFGMTVAPDTLANLHKFLSQEKFLSRSTSSTQAPLSGTVIRGVTLTLGGQQTRLVIMDDGKDKALPQLEQMLLEILHEVVKHPLRAAQAALSLTRDGAMLQPALTITNVGTEPLPLVFFDPAQEYAYLVVDYVFTQNGTPAGSVTTSWDEISALAASGELPSGVQSLAPGASVQFSLPPIAAPSADPALSVMGTVSLWLPDPAWSSLRNAQAQTPAYPLPPATAPEAGSASGQTPLELSLASAQSSYRLDETIYVTVTLRNTGTAPLTINGRLLLNHETAPESVRDLYFEINAPPGYKNQRLFRVNAGRPTDRDLVTLQPGGIQERSIELTRFHSLHLTGKYTLVAHYLNTTPVSGFEVWQGTLASLPLVLERR